MKNTENQFLRRQVSYWNGRLAGQLHWRLEKTLAPLDVTASQFAVMMALSDGAAKPSELAEALDVDAGAVTRLLDRLGEKGLLSRCEMAKKGDRRCVSVELSAQGKAMLPKLRRAAEGLQERLLEGMKDRQRRELLGSLQNLYEKVRRMS